MKKIEIFIDDTMIFGDGEVVYGGAIDDENIHSYFSSEAMAIVNVGLTQTDLSSNDVMYISRYIAAMINGLEK